MKNSKITAPVVQPLGVSYFPEPFVDASQTGVTYYGWAPIGTGETDEGWRIMKEVVVNGVTKRLYAQGTMDFRFKWSERTSYSYSR